MTFVTLVGRNLPSLTVCSNLLCATVCRSYEAIHNSQPLKSSSIKNIPVWSSRFSHLYSISLHSFILYIFLYPNYPNWDPHIRIIKSPTPPTPSLSHLPASAPPPPPLSLSPPSSSSRPRPPPSLRPTSPPRLPRRRGHLLPRGRPPLLVFVAGAAPSFLAAGFPSSSTLLPPPLCSPPQFAPPHPSAPAPLPLPWLCSPAPLPPALLGCPAPTPFLAP